MNYVSAQITFREIPEQVCLSFLIAGCPVKCPDCNSKDTWSVHSGKKLNEEEFSRWCESKREWISCVLFLGGEWEKDQLIVFLKKARLLGLKTALYTGLEDVDMEIKEHLDYLKIGPYMKERGGLESPTTNQILRNLKTGERITPFKEETHDTSQ